MRPFGFAYVTILFAYFAARLRGASRKPSRVISQQPVSSVRGGIKAAVLTPSSFFKKSWGLYRSEDGPRDAAASILGLLPESRSVLDVRVRVLRSLVCARMILDIAREIGEDGDEDIYDKLCQISVGFTDEQRKNPFASPKEEGLDEIDEDVVTDLKREGEGLVEELKSEWTRLSNMSLVPGSSPTGRKRMRQVVAALARLVDKRDKDLVAELNESVCRPVLRSGIKEFNDANVLEFVKDGSLKSSEYDPDFVGNVLNADEALRKVFSEPDLIDSNDRDVGVLVTSLIETYLSTASTPGKPEASTPGKLEASSPKSVSSDFSAWSSFMSLAEKTSRFADSSLPVDGKRVAYRRRPFSSPFASRATSLELSNQGKLLLALGNIYVSLVPFASPEKGIRHEEGIRVAMDEWNRKRTVSTLLAEIEHSSARARLCSEKDPEQAKRRILLMKITTSILTEVAQRATKASIETPTSKTSSAASSTVKGEKRHKSKDALCLTSGPVAGSISQLLALKTAHTLLTMLEPLPSWPPTPTIQAARDLFATLQDDAANDAELCRAWNAVASEGSVYATFVEQLQDELGADDFMFSPCKYQPPKPTKGQNVVKSNPQEPQENSDEAQRKPDEAQGKPDEAQEKPLEANDKTPKLASRVPTRSRSVSPSSRNSATRSKGPPTGQLPSSPALKPISTSSMLNPAFSHPASKPRPESPNASSAIAIPAPTSPKSTKTSPAAPKPNATLPKPSSASLKIKGPTVVPGHESSYVGSDSDLQRVLALSAAEAKAPKQDAVPHPIYPGLENPASMCYANSVVQVLAYIPELVTLVKQCATAMSNYNPPSKKELTKMPLYQVDLIPTKPYVSAMLDSLLDSIHSLIGKSGKKVASVRRLIELLGAKKLAKASGLGTQVTAPFTVHQQAAADEFLNFLLDLLKDEMRATGLLNEFEELIIAKRNIYRTWELADFRPKKEKRESWMPARAAGRSKGAISDVPVTALPIDVPMPQLANGKKQGFHTLKELWTHYFAPERQPESELYNVEEDPNRKVVPTVVSAYIQWPKLLFIALNRFKSSKYAGITLKDDQPVHYPLVLDLRDNGAGGLYDLHGVVVHEGSHATGHYYSFIRFTSPSSSKKQFVVFNDKDVQDTRNSHAMEHYFGRHPSHPRNHKNVQAQTMAIRRLEHINSDTTHRNEFEESDGDLLKRITKDFTSDHDATPCAQLLVYIRRD